MGVKVNEYEPEFTYEIGVKDAFRLLSENEEFCEFVKNGNFVYCEDRFVRNLPKYVTFSEDKKLQLTEYAKTHNEECCIVFTLEPVSANTKKEIQTEKE